MLSNVCRTKSFESESRSFDLNYVCWGEESSSIDFKLFPDPDINFLSTVELQPKNPSQKDESMATERKNEKNIEKSRAIVILASQLVNHRSQIMVEIRL